MACLELCLALRKHQIDIHTRNEKKQLEMAAQLKFMLIFSGL